MSAAQTDKDIRVEYISKMGPELGAFFFECDHELTYVHWRWWELKTLFETPKRVDILNQSAPFFFHVVQETIFEQTLLGIARLAGPAKSVGRDNLSIQRFPALISDQPLRDEVWKLIEATKDVTRFAKDWRNRRLAHRDLELLLKPTMNPLPEATRENIEKALSSIRAVLEAVEVHYCHSHTAYNAHVSPWGARTLLYTIRDGLVSQANKQRRFQRNELLEEDLKPDERI